MIIKKRNLNDYIQKSQTAKTSRMLIFITPEEREALKSLSYTTGLSMTEILRRSLYNTLNS
jgi:hypothetical protein